MADAPIEADEGTAAPAFIDRGCAAPRVHGDS